MFHFPIHPATNTWFGWGVLGLMINKKGFRNHFSREPFGNAIAVHYLLLEVFFFAFFFAVFFFAAFFLVAFFFAAFFFTAFFLAFLAAFFFAVFFAAFFFAGFLLTAAPPGRPALRNVHFRRIGYSNTQALHTSRFS
jgi:hypothetical protein